MFVKLLLQASKDSDKLDGQDGLVECEETALTEGTFWGYPVYEIQWFGVGDQAQLWRTQQQDILRWNNQQMAQLAEQNRLYQQQLYAQMNDIEEEEDLLR